jgi:hypothetical protein
MMSRRHIIAIFALTFFWTSCMEKRTQDALKTYKYWSGGEEPPIDVHVAQGQYWQSAHWSKEYEIYLEIFAPPYWAEELIRQNELVLDGRTYDHSSSIQETPQWFRPDGQFELYGGRGGSTLLYWDRKNGHLLFYEIQL